MTGTHILSLFISVLSVAVAGSATDAGEKKSGEDAWKHFKSRHFIVCHRGNEEFAGKISRTAEEHFARISSRLGYTQYDNFWLWENRVKIYVFPDKQAFTAAENAPGWAAGKAAVEERKISTYEGSESFMHSVMPHEITHLVFREFVGADKTVPLWLTEGIAQLQEQGRKEKALAVVRQMAAENRLLSLRAMTATDIEQIRADAKKVHEYYAVSVCVASFMLEKFGPESFRKFSGQIRDGRNVDDALRFTYPGTIRNIEELERAWLKDLKEAK